MFMKIQSITLALLSALALASCSSISTEIGTNEMADNSFPVEGEAVEEGDVLYYKTPSSSELFPKKKPEIAGNDILIEGKLTKTTGMGITRDFLLDTFMSNARVYSQIWEGRITSEHETTLVKFDTHVGFISDSTKDFILKSAESPLGKLEFIDRYSSQEIQTPYKTATFMPNGGGNLGIYATKQRWWRIERGKNATDEQFEKVNKQPGMNMKSAFREKRQVFQVTDEEGAVLADFTKNSYRIFPKGEERRDEARSALSLFLAWIWVCDETLEQDNQGEKL